jgi:hypothetical protein
MFMNQLLYDTERSVISRNMPLAAKMAMITPITPSAEACPI